MKTLLMLLSIVICNLVFGQKQIYNYQIINTIPKISAYAILPDIHVYNDSLSIDYKSGYLTTFGSEHNVKIFETNEKYLEFLKNRRIIENVNDIREEIDENIKDFLIITFLIADDGSLTNLKIVKPVENNEIKTDIIRIFRGLPKITPPKDKTNKNIWTIVTCRIYYEITPLKKTSKLKPEIHKMTKTD